MTERQVEIVSGRIAVGLEQRFSFQLKNALIIFYF